MKKLFIWIYTHYPNFQNVCALDSDGTMIMSIFCRDGKETIRQVFSDNNILTNEYDMIVVNQKDLEEHIYKNGPRDLLPKDFQIAWDKYKLGEDKLS